MKKVEYQISTGQFEYILIKEDVDSIEAAVDAYTTLQRAYKGGEGLPTKEFNACLDQYLKDGTGETEKFFAMSKDQQRIFQEIKKSLNRIKIK